MMKTIGIIGGMGPLATADLYQKIILNTAADSDQEHLHVIIDSNTAIPDRTKYILSHGENPVPKMVESIRLLEASGAELLIMPCNTAHYFYEELAQASSVPLLNMLELAASYVKAHFSQTETIGLLSTDGTVQSGIYDEYFAAVGLHLTKPEKHQAAVMAFIYEGIKKNRFDMGTDGLFQAVEELKSLGASNFILGCTELSAASSRYHFGPAFVDPLLLLARESIQRAGGVVMPQP